MGEAGGEKKITTEIVATLLLPEVRLVSIFPQLINIERLKGDEYYCVSYSSIPFMQNLLNTELQDCKN